MDFFKLIKERRSIRNYKDKEIPLDVIKEILNDCVMAPNGRNRQAWRFIVINSMDFMKKITDSRVKRMLEDLEKNPDSPFKEIEARIRSGEFRPFYNAPALILILGPDDIPVLPIDCAILSGYFMLSAAARGLGTCFAYSGMSIDDTDISSEIDIPEGYQIFGSLILGYPKEIPPMPPRNEPVILKVIS